MSGRLTEAQLISLATMAGELDEPSLEAYADIARTNRRHNGILPSEALEHCRSAIARHGLVWSRGRGWVIPAGRTA